MKILTLVVGWMRDWGGPIQASRHGLIRIEVERTIVIVIERPERLQILLCLLSRSKYKGGTARPLFGECNSIVQLPW
jgi:hypothetical protein